MGNTYLFRLILENKRKIFILFIISAIYSALLLFNLNLLNSVIGYSIETKVNLPQYIIKWIPAGVDFFIVVTSLFIMFSIVVGVIAIINDILNQKIVNSIIARYEKNLIGNMVGYDFRFFAGSKQGELVYATTNATQGVAWVVQNVADIIRNLIIFMTLLIYMLWTSSIAFILIGAIGVFYIVLYRSVFTKTINNAAMIRTKNREAKNVVLNEFITWVKAIKAFNTGRKWSDWYSKNLDGELHNYYILMVSTKIGTSILSMLTFVIIGALGIVFYLYADGNLSDFVGRFTIIGLLLYKMLPTLQGINTNIITLKRCIPDLKIIYNILDSKSEEIDNGSEVFHGIKNSIKFNNVAYSFVDGKDVLKDINLSINKNEITAFVGKSGSGKSTLVNLLVKLYSPINGTIEVDGVNIERLTKKSYLKKIGYVGQDIALINDTVVNNIIFGREGTSLEQVVAACKIANAHEFIDALNDKYDTIIGDGGNRLSGGQRQRLVIARAVLDNPELLIFDEATSALDNISEKLVQEAVEKLSTSITVVVIAHRLSTIQNANTIYVLKDGKIHARGTHEQLLQINRYYQNLYYSELKDEKTDDNE